MPDEGQNPSITWLLKSQSFYERADQVMMKRNGLFGKWRQYTNRGNVNFLNDLDVELDTIDQFMNCLDHLLTTGSLAASTSKLANGSIVIFPDLRKLLLHEVEASVLRMSPNDFVRMKQDQYNMKIEDLERGKEEKIRAYHDSLHNETTQGVYKGMGTPELRTLLDDFTNAQQIRFASSRHKLREKLKQEIDQFIDSKHTLNINESGSNVYLETHQAMYSYGVVMSENADLFIKELQHLITSIQDKHGVEILLGGILSKHLRTSQLLQDNTLNIENISLNDPEKMVDQYLLQLCSLASDMDNNPFGSAQVVSTNIPNKLLISSFKLPAAEMEKNGYQGRWCVDSSYNLEKLIDWVK